ncbi:Collagen alpha-5(VI) chain, partial [Colletotrichum sp. SAR 10_70]
MQIQSVLVTIGALAATAAAKPNHLPFKHKDGNLAIVNGTIVTLTRVHQQVETWCPEPTTLYFNNRTYKIDKPTTFKIPDCPCTEIYTTHYDHGYYPTGVVPPAPAPPVETGVPGTECGGSPCPGPAPTGPAVPPQVPGQSGAPGPAPSAPAVP